jgi:hypothetical protein
MAGVITSCQKEEFQSEMVLPSHEMSQKLLAHQELTLRYWIDGVEHNQEYASQQEMDEYISYLIGLTREGKTIIIQGSENPSYAPVENDKLTVTTKDEDKMDAWAEEMYGKGYDVKVSFDEKTGLYTGTATKGGSRTMDANLVERE